MKIRALVIKEILHRKFSFILGLVSIAVAIGSLAGSLALLKAHDMRTQGILERKRAQTKAKMDKLEDDMRKAMLKLGFNVVILPAEQNLGDWYADDYGSKYMPEDYVHRLADSGVIRVRHFLPSLQQKVRWPERKRTIILVGARGEVPNLHKKPRRPLVQPVPAGTMVVGYELHQSLGLKVGDKVKLLGREFTVHRCQEERGSKDDITVWIHLSEAQELLDKQGLINAILALQCVCVSADTGNLRADIARVLPDTQVIEIGSRVLARGEARRHVGEEAKAALEREKKLRWHLREEREGFASVLVAVVMAACGIWIGFLALGNVRERRAEIGIFRALGFRSGKIFSLFLSKAILMGLVGGAVGIVPGFFAGRFVGETLERGSGDAATAQATLDPLLVVVAFALAVCLSALASWIPAMIAVQQDPADILREA